ncbi:MAG: hypothetical protein RLY60_1501, partial [Pseudomonadota bacterium]
MWSKKRLAAVALMGTLCVVSGFAKVETLLNVSYDVSREFYKDYNAAFIAHYKKTKSIEVKVDQSHGGSSAQARA